MKQWSVLLFLCLLTGCTAAPAADLTAVQNRPVSTAAEPAAEEACYYTVDIVTWADSVQDEDGAVLAEYSYQLPELTARRTNGTAVLDALTETEEQALETANAFNSQFAPWTQAEEFQEMVDMAREERLWREENGIDWTSALFSELTCQTYQTEKMVSVMGTYYSYTGGVHPNTVLMTWNFDLTTGTFFDIPALAEDGPVFLEEVKEELIRQANTPQEDWNGFEFSEGDTFIPALGYWENYEDIMADWSSYAVSFDGEGMNVAFSPYELAAYAAGSQAFHVSYGWMRPYLSVHGLELLGLEAPED